MSFNIDNTSYTNKDFREIFAELLQLVPELTSRWDPNASNESDPGVVLLKLSAFIADKLNYNIDKNILENFPASVTQRGNAQKLYDLLGYDLSYYKSATVPVLLRYSKNGNDADLVAVEGNNTNSYVIPKFTELKDDSSSVVYTLVDDVTVSITDESSDYGKGQAIEGTIHTYSINGVDTITIDNLDADNRLYFNESMIPSNGIFIYNVNEPSERWQPVKNLQATPLGSKVYKFGVIPQSNTVYLEFPQDASRVFGEGINIKYVITKGVEGNIAGFTLTQLNAEVRSSDVYVSGTEPTDDGVDVGMYTLVYNTSSSNNGANPESLESAYKNFKKAVNTFETLVTCADYTNAVQSSEVVSNAVVSDRTNDLNNSYTVRTQTTDSGLVTLNYNNFEYDATKQDYKKPTKCMDTFELSMYALNLQPSVVDATTYNNTFTTSPEAELSAINSLNMCKSLQHDWKRIDYTDSGVNTPFIFKNLYEVSGKILTHQKVTKAESAEIENNVQLALFKRFNAKEVEFGKEIAFEDLLDTVRQADKRIKEVLLDSPKLVVNYMNSKNQLTPLSFDNTNAADNVNLNKIVLDIVAKSILAGVTPYCVWNTKSTPHYYMQPLTQKQIITTEGSPMFEGDDIVLQDSNFSETSTVVNAVTENVTAITTQVTITVPKGGQYTLKENETIQLYAPNFVSTANISTYMLVAVQLQGTGRSIEANEIYQLAGTEKLFVAENRDELISLMENTSFKPQKNYKIYEAGTLIKPSCKLESAVITTVDSKKVCDQIVWLETTNCVDIMEPNSVIINNGKDINAAWIVDEPENNLFPTGTTERILGNNEIFMYTDSKKESLVVLQSGTRLSYTGSKITSWKCDKPSMSDVEQNGVNSSIEWFSIPKETDVGLNTSEMQIVTLGPGSVIKYTTRGESSELVIMNTPKVVDDVAIKYQASADSEELSLSKLPAIVDETGSSVGWKIFSRLQFLSSPDTVFTLKDTDDRSKQYLQLYTDDVVTNESIPVLTLVNGASVTTNLLTVLSGGVRQNTASSSDTKLAVTVFRNDEKNCPLTDGTNTSKTFETPTQITSNYNMYTIKGSELPLSGTTRRLRLTFSEAFKGAIIPVKFIANTEQNVTVKYEGAVNAQMNIYTVKLSENKVYNLTCDGTIYYLEITQAYKDYINFDIEGLPDGDTLCVYLYSPKRIDDYSVAVKNYAYQADSSNSDSFDKYVVLRELAKLSYITTDDTKNTKASLFDYTYESQDGIDDPLESSSFFNSAHVCNRHTIAQLDTSKLNIKVADQSKVK